MAHLDLYVPTDVKDTTPSAMLRIYRAWVLPKFVRSWAALTETLDAMEMPTKLKNSINHTRAGDGLERVLVV